MLDRIRVAKPCPASWAEMEGDDKVRYCSICDQRVYNLTAMSRAESEQLIANRQGRLCLRYYRRYDGRIMTKDCPKGVRGTRIRAAMKAGSLLAFLVSLTGANQPNDGSGAPLMGKLAVDPPHQTEPAEQGFVTGAVAAPATRRRSTNPANPEPVERLSPIHPAHERYGGKRRP